MKHFAIIENQVVVNVAIAASPLAYNWVDLTDMTPEPGVGWGYVDGVFVEPPAPPAVVEPATPWSKKDFLLKFSPAEYGAIKAAALVSHDIDYYWTLFNVSGDVLKTDLVTIAGINALESAGFLAEGRAAEILA